MAGVFIPTERDMTILCAYARGDEDEEIGRIFDRNSSTVSSWAQEMRSAMGARNRSHAVALAYDWGILPADGAP